METSNSKRQGAVMSRALQNLLDEAKERGCANPRLFLEPESMAVFVLDGDHPDYGNDRHSSRRQGAIVLRAPLTVTPDAGAW